MKNALNSHEESAFYELYFVVESAYTIIVIE